MDASDTRPGPSRHGWWWLAVIAWMGVIFRLSALPGVKVPIPGPLGEVGHLAGYAVLGGLTLLALGTERGTRRAIALAIIISSAYGVSDEFHQSFVPGRTPDLFDWGVDTLGAAAGAIMAAVATRRAALRRPFETRDR